MNVHKVVETSIKLRFEIERLLENYPNDTIQKLINQWDKAFDEGEVKNVRQ